jgi:hypothetical protein
MSTPHLSEQEQLRREKLAELIIMGIEPYPAPLFPVNSNSLSIKENSAAAGLPAICDLYLSGFNTFFQSRIVAVRNKLLARVPACVNNRKNYMNKAD